MYKLDIGSKTHHYTYCPDCKMALFVDDETEEDKARKRDSLILMLEEVEVKRLRSEVSKLSSKLTRRKNLLSEMEAELAIKIEEHNSKYNHQQVEL